MREDPPPHSDDRTDARAERIAAAVVCAQHPHLARVFVVGGVDRLDRRAEARALRRRVLVEAELPRRVALREGARRAERERLLPAAARHGRVAVREREAGGRGRVGVESCGERPIGDAQAGRGGRGEDALAQGLLREGLRDALPCDLREAGVIRVGVSGQALL